MKSHANGTLLLGLKAYVLVHACVVIPTDDRVLAQHNVLPRPAVHVHRRVPSASLTGSMKAETQSRSRSWDGITTEYKVRPGQLRVYHALGPRRDKFNDEIILVVAVDDEPRHGVLVVVSQRTTRMHRGQVAMNTLLCRDLTSPLTHGGQK